MMDGKNVLRAEELAVGWHGKVVAKIAALNVESGKIVALAGPNGVGKSTTMKTLARQIAPVSGAVLIDGMRATELSARAFAAQVAYVPQLLDAPRGMTVRDMVALGRNPHQIWWSWSMNDNDCRAVDAALAATETEPLARKLVADLSGGERQRVALATALAQESKFLLLDEPTAHLDFKHQLQLVSLLNGLRSRSLGMLVVLHDLNLIARVADEVVLLKRTQQGIAEIAAAGTVDSVLQPGTLMDVYDVEVAIGQDAASGLRTYVPISAKSPAP